MGKAVKIAIGCLIALLLACVISFVLVFFVFKGIKNKITSFFPGGSVRSFTEKVEKLQKMNTEYHFTEPSDGTVSEDSLTKYIEIKKSLQPLKNKYGILIQSIEGRQKPDIKSVGRISKATMEVLTTYADLFEKNKMSPGEYIWIKNKMMEAGTESIQNSPSEGVSVTKQMLEQEKANLESQLQAMPEDQRADMQSQIDSIASQLQELVPEEKPVSQNVVLYNKYKGEIESNNTDILDTFIAGYSTITN